MEGLKLAVQTSRPAAIGVRALVTAVVITNVIGNLLLTRGMRDIGQVVSINPFNYLRAFANPWVSAGVGLLIAWTIAQLSLLSRADLSYVLPVTSAAYALSALAGQVFLGEYISLLRWGGILLITGGVLMVSRTTPRTHHAPTVIHPPSEVHIALGVEQE